MTRDATIMQLFAQDLSFSRNNVSDQIGKKWIDIDLLATKPAKNMASIGLITGAPPADSGQVCQTDCFAKKCYFHEISLVQLTSLYACTRLLRLQVHKAIQSPELERPCESMRRRSL